MAKTYLSNGAVIASGTASSNYVQQIAAGGSNFDIAVQNGIKFFNGSTDSTGLVWNGSAPFEVVIPTLADLVVDPIRFAGTVGSDGTPKDSQNNTLTPAKGDLVYITANCTFASIACEAGDMAVYDGAVWHVISGENQVSIAGGTVDASGNHSVSLGKEGIKVLDVEGKELSLAINYTDVRNNIGFSTNASNTISVLNGQVAVAPMYVALSQKDGSTKDISTSMSIDLPTTLASGVVTISDKVLVSGDFTFTSGSFPTISKNESAITVNASHSMTIAKSNTTGDFVTDVVAIKAISFGDGSAASNDFGYVASLSSIAGTSFVSGIHTYDSTKDKGKTADFSIWGQATVATSTFVNGLGEASNAGDLVSAITVGTVSLDANGSGILTGVDANGSDFLTGVSFGNLATDVSSQWFFSGLNANGSQVVTDVTVGAVTLSAAANSTFAGSAITSASVSNHVLTFSTGSFMTPVSISQASSTIAKADFVKSGVKMENTSVSKAGFTSASLVQAATEVSYRSLLTDNVTLSQTSTSYFFDKAQDHNYEVVMGYTKVTVTDADVIKNGAVIENPTITASIPANSVAVDVTGGTLPTFSVGSATGTISGTVGTSLSTSNVSWLAIDESKKSFTIPGAYSLETVVSGTTGAVEVGAVGTYDVNNATVTISADTYVTDISVDGSSVAPAPVQEGD